MTDATYVIQKCGSSYCPTCKRKVHLLTPRAANDKGKSFYICFVCQAVSQVGYGVVRKG